MFQKIKRFFRRELWEFSLRDLEGRRHFFFKALRIGVLAVRGFVRDKCFERASSLTYYTLMSVVPVLAMTFAIARSFGYQEYLQRDLLERFQEQRDVLLQILPISNRLIQQAKSGIIAAVSFAILFWSVTQLLSNLESALNAIWGVKKLRSWRRLFSDYFALIVIAPLFFVLSSSVMVYIVKYLEEFAKLSSFEPLVAAFLWFFVHLIPYALFWILFAFIYLFMPNTRVRFFSALVGGFIAGTLYVVLQWGYIYFQIGVSRYGTIYGSFAALPLFLIWVQLSWFLLLFGAEITFAHQTHEQREYETVAERTSYQFRLAIALWIVQICVERFLKKEGPVSVDLFVRQYQIPYSIAQPLLRELTEAGLLAEGKGNKESCRVYILNHDPDQLRISDVLNILQERGGNDLTLSPSPAFDRLRQAMQSFREQILHSPDNLLLKDLSR